MPLAFASRLVERVTGAVKAARFTRLDDMEKRAVMRLLHAVALADGVLSATEIDELKRIASELSVKTDADLSLHDAVNELAKKPRSLKLACLLVADAFFVDGDYDDAEKKFVETFAERFQLPTNPLKDAVEKLRQKKLDDALAEWNAEIA